jgi:hypothetical protein
VHGDDGPGRGRALERRDRELDDLVALGVVALADERPAHGLGVARRPRTGQVREALRDDRLVREAEECAALGCGLGVGSGGERLGEELLEKR